MDNGPSQSRKRSYEEASLGGEWEPSSGNTKRKKSYSTMSYGTGLLSGISEVADALQDADNEIRRAESSLLHTCKQNDNLNTKSEELSEEYQQIGACQSLDCVSKYCCESQKLSRRLWNICIEWLWERADRLSDALPQKVHSKISQLQHAKSIGENELLEYGSLSKQVDLAQDARVGVRNTDKAPLKERCGPSSKPVDYSKEAEEILRCKWKGEWKHFLVKWKGLPEEKATWVKKSDLDGGLIDRYERELRGSSR